MLVNGKEMNIYENDTVKDLLETLNVSENRVVVELNGEIIVKEKFDDVNLKEDDTVEVISFVGGG